MRTRCNNQAHLHRAYEPEADPLTANRSGHMLIMSGDTDITDSAWHHARCMHHVLFLSLVMSSRSKPWQSKSQRASGTVISNNEWHYPYVTCCVLLDYEGLSVRGCTQEELSTNLQNSLARTKFDVCNHCE